MIRTNVILMIINVVCMDSICDEIYRSLNGLQRVFNGG